MKVLGIGYGRHLFDENNFEHKRLQSCAGAVDSFDHVVFTLKKERFEKLEVGNFTIHPTNSSSKFSMLFDAVKVGRKLIREKQITVISTQDVFETGFVGLQLKKKFESVTLQVQEHGDVLSSVHWRREKFSNKLRYWFAFRVLKRADIVRVVSKRTKNFLLQRLGADKKIHTFPVVIDILNFEKLTASKKIKSDTFTFITAARFVPQKNFSLMIIAFAEVYKTNPHIRLKIFGEGELESGITALVKKLELTSVIEINSWTKDLAGEMKKADAYLLTSNYEGWARVLIEAMVLGLPTVTTDVGCVGEVLIDGEHGLVVPVGDKNELVSAMRRISVDSVLHEQLIENLSRISTSSISGTDIKTYPQDWALTLQ